MEKNLIQINGAIMINKCWCECKKHHPCEIEYIWNPAKCSCKNGKYSANITDDSVITCNKIIEDKKQLQPILMKKNAICKTKTFLVLLAFLLILIVLLIAVSIYCYLINYKETKHTYYHFTSQKIVNRSFV